MDDKSTPISNLNNKNDESEVVNQILKKYNNLEDGDGSTPLNNMENQFENRNLNQEMYDLKADNIAYQDHYEKELQRTNNKNIQNVMNVQNVNDQYIEDEDEYEEYEVVQLPLWKRILNEIRIPFYIIIFILILFNSSFDKLLMYKFPFFGNQFNDCNTYGFLLKAFLVSLLSYIFIRFIRF